jgi:outer membrane protein TolC
VHPRGRCPQNEQEIGVRIPRLTVCHFCSVSKILLLIAAALGAGGTAAPAAPLSLQQAEEMALQQSAPVAVARAGGERATAEKKAHYGKLLPSLDVGREYSEQEVRTSGGTETLLRSGVTSLTIEEDIDNPLVWHKNLKISQTSEQLAGLREGNARLDTLSQVRGQYFQAVIAEATLKTATENLRLTRETLGTAEKRYKSGYVPREDLMRARVQVGQSEFELEAAKEDLRYVRGLLAFAVGLPATENFTLTSRLPEGFAYFSRTADQLKTLAGSGESFALRAKRLELERQDLIAERARLAYLPDLSFGAVYQKLDPDARGTEPLGPRYFVAAEWNLFNGGQDYHTRVAELATRNGLATELERMSTERAFLTERYVQLLKNLQLKHQSQKMQVDTLGDILKNSSQRYSQGHVSSKQVTDDFAAYLAAQVALTRVVSEIVKTLSDFARETGDPTLFHKLF